MNWGLGWWGVEFFVDWLSESVASGVGAEYGVTLWGMVALRGPGRAVPCPGGAVYGDGWLPCWFGILRVA